MSVQSPSASQDQQEQIDSSQPVEAPSTRSSRRSRKSASAFRTISEVANELDVQQHVLRFWETKFSQVRPLKRGGGRRYYRPEDVALLKSIHHLLYTEGYTIKGVQKLLREQGKNAVVQNNKPATDKPVEGAGASVSAPMAPKPQVAVTEQHSNNRAALESVLDELKDLKRYISSEE